jgi:hypothetical protein
MNLARRSDYLERLDTVRSLSIFRKDWRARMVDGVEKLAPKATPKATPKAVPMASMPPPQGLPRRTLQDVLPSSLQPVPLTPSLQSLPPTPSHPPTPDRSMPGTPIAKLGAFSKRAAKGAAKSAPRKRSVAKSSAEGKRRGKREWAA